MNIYLIFQNVNTGYDTYDSAVVVAEDQEQARRINPGQFHVWSNEQDSWMFEYSDGRPAKKNEDSTWTRPENVKVQYLGEAANKIKGRIICASFNAG